MITSDQRLDLSPTWAWLLSPAPEPATCKVRGFPSIKECLVADTLPTMHAAIVQYDPFQLPLMRSWVKQPEPPKKNTIDSVGDFWL
jgi:hypothetical protein